MHYVRPRYTLVHRLEYYQQKNSSIKNKLKKKGPAHDVEKSQITKTLECKTSKAHVFDPV